MTSYLDNQKEFNNFLNSVEIEDLCKILQSKLEDLTTDNLREKCKAYNITNYTKLKKKELIQSLLDEYTNVWNSIKDEKVEELKNICKMNNIKGYTGLNKKSLVILIMDHHLTKEDMSIVSDIVEDNKEKKQIEEIFIPNINISKTDIILKQKQFDMSSATNSLSALEKQKKEIERQQQEIELSLKLEIEKQKKEQEMIEKQKKEQERLEYELLLQQSEQKKKKQAIPKNVKTIVWNNYIGPHINSHRCLCCKKVLIDNTNFEVGHVISEKDGGTHEINNLRPICGACNHSMGTMNMIEFVKKYGLYIG